ncbi:hypothetical protein ACQ1ZA_16110, partial [Enterococcus faecalis]|uniref:hypothetical protein n=1 Tax=Enterococcus faecalis TaxID=1351 RepID=UPI003D6BF526
YGTQISTLKNYRGMSGWLKVSLVSVQALGNLEERLVVAAVTNEGDSLAEDDPEKILRLPANVAVLCDGDAPPPPLAED